MSEKTNRNPWGDPNGSTFARRYTTLVAVDDMRVRVHRTLAPLIERILSDLSVTDLVVDQLEGHPVSPTGTGLRLVLKPANQTFVAATMHRFGFAPTEADPDLYEWSLGHEEAEAVVETMRQAAAEQPQADGQEVEEGVVVVPVAEEPYGPENAPRGPLTAEEALIELMVGEDWWENPPGSRDLLPGTEQVGRDVLFLQAYLDVPRTGRYDAATVHAVGYFQGRRGLAADGHMLRNGWQQFLPRLRQNLHPGDSGRHVRILCAAMIAAGHISPTEPVSARFNQRLQREVREMQERHGQPRTGKVTRLDWGHLLEYPW